MSIGRVARMGVILASVSLLGVAACGSRGPLLDDPVGGRVDASADDAAADAAQGDAADADASPADAATEAAPTPLQCGQCIFQQCGSKLQTCLTDPPCQQILQCVTQKCLLGGSGLDPQCLQQCAGNDLSALAEAFAAVQCITGKCGSDCLPFLGGLGGGN